MRKLIALVAGAVFLLAGCSMHHKCGCHGHHHHKHHKHAHHHGHHHDHAMKADVKPAK